MDAVSSAAQFFSAPASGGKAGAVSGAAALFGNGGEAALGAGLIAPTGKAAEVVATFENLLAALINGDGDMVQNALNAAVADGAVTMDKGKLALGPALQQIVPADLASGKPTLDQLIADGKAAPAAALLAMLLNGDGDVPPIKIGVAAESGPAVIAPDLADLCPVEPAAPSEPKPAKGAKTISLLAVEAVSVQSTVLVAPALSTVAPGDKSPASVPTTESLSDAVPAIAAAPTDDTGATLDDSSTDKDAKTAREQAALDLMAALMARQPVAPPPAAPKAGLELTIEAAAAPTEPAPLTDLPTAPLVAAPLSPTSATATPEKTADTQPDFASELAPPQSDALAPKHLVAAKTEQSTRATGTEDFAPTVAARPVNDGAPTAPLPATSSAANATGSDAGTDLNSDGRQQSDSSQRQPAEIDLQRSSAMSAETGRASGHQDFASQLANASRGSLSGGSSAQLPAFQQVAVQIRRAVIEGDNHLSIQLKPAELGRIDVRLHFTGDGRVSAHVTADNVATLDLMQRDTRGLERALHDAGLQTDSGSLSFNLRGDNRQAHDQQDQRGASANARFTLDGPVEPEAEELPAGRWVPAGRVDVRV